MKAKFSKETKEQILNRDLYCIICKTKWEYNNITDYHHVFFWIEAEYWDDRNDVNKWVWLCRNCHYEIHHWKDWNNETYRNICKEYIKNK